VARPGATIRRAIVALARRWTGGSRQDANPGRGQAGPSMGASPRGGGGERGGGRHEERRGN
jgi:hypothetical protein